tara:strand:+ start:724 stop:1158 length:435 start_codon:yes stop_codon:yes gene_type:complete
MIAILRYGIDFYRVALIDTTEQLNLAIERNNIIIAFNKYIARNNIKSMYHTTEKFYLYKEKIFNIEEKIKNNCKILTLKQSKILLLKGKLNLGYYFIELDKDSKNYYAKEMKNWFTGKRTLHQIQNGIFAPHYLLDYEGSKNDN